MGMFDFIAPFFDPVSTISNVFGGGDSGILNDLTEGEGGEAVRITEPQTPAEKAIEDLLLQIYGLADRGVRPSEMVSVVDDFITDMNDAEQMFRDTTGRYETKLAGLADKYNLNEQEFRTATTEIGATTRGYTSEYRGELAGIAKTPGVPIAFGGQPMGEMKPRKTMGLLSDIAGQRFKGGMEESGLLRDLALDRYEAGMGTTGALSNLATQEYGAGMALPTNIMNLAGKRMSDITGPLMNMYLGMYEPRYGGGTTVTPYQPSFLELLLPAAGQIGAGYASGAAGG